MTETERITWAVREELVLIIGDVIEEFAAPSSGDYAQYADRIMKVIEKAKNIPLEIGQIYENKATASRWRVERILPSSQNETDVAIVVNVRKPKETKAYSLEFLRIMCCLVGEADRK